MNKTIRVSLSLYLFFFGALVSRAQINQVGRMISGSTSDAEQLFSAYLKPYANAFGADLNGGWYNTAKTHKLLGFDLTFSLSTAMVPSADKSFDVNALHLQGNPVVTGGSLAPTVAGAQTSGPTLTYNQTVAGKTYTLAQFSTPQGTGIGVIPAPMLQLGVGLVKGTEIVGRYLPKLNLGKNGSAQMWGIGIKHSIKQWIPGIKMAPFFHLSFFGGFTQLKTSAGLNFQPTDLINMTGAQKGNIDSTLYTHQQMQLVFKSFTANVIASFDLPIVTFYGGIGFSSTTSTLNLAGVYPMAGVMGSTVTVDDSYSVANPFNISMKTATKPRLNAGIKFKFAVITLNFDYTRANYSVFTAGMGLSVR